eukprot:218712-Pelagomonas_calceolata.AAC.2
MFQAVTTGTANRQWQRVQALVGALTLRFCKLQPQALQKDPASRCSLKVKSTLLVLTVATCGAMMA